MRVVASPALINRWFNPYNWLLNTHLAKEGVQVQSAVPWRLLRGSGDVWHVHWPDYPFNQRGAAQAALRARAFLGFAGTARRRGMRLIWTVHNLQSHDGQHAELERDFWMAFLPLVDGLIHLSHAGRAAAEVRYPELIGRPAWVIPHGHYRGEYDTPMDRHSARTRLKLPAHAPVVLFSGRIRPYKNVPALIRAFAALPDRSARCLITGATSSATVRTEIELLARGDDRVTLDLRHLPRTELAATFRAADLVVLPYREILNSGSALLALSLDRPVLVPNRGALAELADTVGPAWVRTYNGDLSPAILASALDWARQAPRGEVAPLDSLAWPAIARAHRDAYASIVGITSRAPVSPPVLRQERAVLGATPTAKDAARAPR